MAKPKEAEVRRMFLESLVDRTELEAGRVKIRIYQVDDLIQAYTRAYEAGYEDGSRKTAKRISRYVEREVLNNKCR